MNAVEQECRFFAQVLKSENQKMIALGAEKVLKMNVSSDIIDKANLQFLVEVYAPKNATARAVVTRSQSLKAQKMGEEKSQILENLAEGAMANYDGTIIPNDFLEVLSIMTFMELDYARIAFFLLTRLSFELENAGDVFDQATLMRDVLPEAAALFQKMHGMMQEATEPIDEGMELDDEEETMDEEDDVAEEEDMDESMDSDDSGIESGSDDEEDVEAVGQEEDVDPSSQKFNNALGEILLLILSNSLKSQNEEMIDIAVDLVNGQKISLGLFEKYEITALVYQHALEHEDARALMTRIENMSEEAYALEKLQIFRHIVQRIQIQKKVINPTMDLLMTYLELDESEYYVQKVIKLLLSLPITLEQCQKHFLKKLMYRFPTMTVDMMKLTVKIRDMEQAAAGSS